MNPAIMRGTTKAPGSSSAATSSMARNRGVSAGELRLSKANFASIETPGSSTTSRTWLRKSPQCSPGRSRESISASATAGTTLVLDPARSTVVVMVLRTSAARAPLPRKRARKGSSRSKAPARSE